ncbi:MULTISPECIES: TrbC/VirB2 family protein [Haloarcula]|uniref:TrbC/VirB2 family protein n=1 Tax=Haloarcula TaxID=2237 RepID=UPI0023EC2F7E|nr:TrbC/VirB2 family protein [Halomicroarcula sp. XH51]
MSRNEAERQDSRGWPSVASLAAGGGALVVLLAAADPALASSSSGASGGTTVVHSVLEVLQLLVGAGTVAVAFVGLDAMRGGHMEWAFYALTAGVVTFLAQRLYHSIHEFGVLPALPGLLTQSLFLVGTALLGLGFVQVYRVMQPR